MESVQSTPEKPTKKRRSHVGFFIRFAISAVAVAALAVVVYVPWRAIEPVKEVVRSVFCYDIFGRTEFGSSPVITHIAEWLS